MHTSPVITVLNYVSYYNEICACCSWELSRRAFDTIVEVISYNVIVSRVICSGHQYLKGLSWIDRICWRTKKNIMLQLVSISSWIPQHLPLWRQLNHFFLLLVFSNFGDWRSSENWKNALQHPFRLSAFMDISFPVGSPQTCFCSKQRNTADTQALG